jgi:hypothetical protein
MIELLALGYLIFAIVVGCVATAKNRSFLGWFLLSLLITPFFALLALIAVPVAKPRRESAFAYLAIAVVMVGAGVFWLMPRERAPATSTAASVILDPCHTVRHPKGFDYISCK